MESPHSKDREAFWRSLLSSVDRRLRAYVKRCHCDHSSFEELIEDVWSLAVDHEIDLVKASGPWAIVHQLARQVCREHVRARRLRNRALMQDWARWMNPGWDETADATAIRWDAVSNAMSMLSEKQRQAVDFRFRWDWPYWAVAAAIQADEQTARVHASRGLRRLRQILAVEQTYRPRRHVHRLPSNCSLVEGRP